MKTRTRRLTIIALVAAAGAIALAEAWFVATPYPKVVTSGTAAIGGPFTLVTTDGKTVSDETYRGKWLLIYFGYTFCPDACPTALTNMSAALQKLGPNASELQPLFITVDPQRDTPVVMTDYLKSFDSRIVGLTGNQAQIDGVLKAYRVYAEAQKSEVDNADYPVSHSAYLYLMDPQGRFANVIQSSEGGEEIAAWLRKQMTHKNG
ncbi:SCO family protein [Bradyrhizobium zhanjiangense]|uniref:SCO family protein n=1 Tax=Bradyrhizobium zhanjiangense TaxID=1325107 RepID=A0ABY0DF11_9BRAD|nr:SCO family protein [Bradyrhizobium zhanjiangense]RXG91105.1 SCO family protein [Bradyrhizobium zhanjiangense]